MPDVDCQAPVAEHVIRQTGELKNISVVTSRPMDVSGARLIIGCSFHATEPYRREIAARDEISRTEAMARQMEIDRLSDLGFVLRSEIDDEA